MPYLAETPTAAACPSNDELQSSAARAFQSNRERNLLALARSQPACDAIAEIPASAGEPVLARDGSLTCFDNAGRWWGGCSLPRRAALVMLKTMEVRGSTACFLAPPHAAHLRVALDRLERRQAVIAVVPDACDLAVMLGCDDFSAEVTSHRLWFVGGSTWAAALGRLFDEQIGLPIPSQFIRLQSLRAEVAEELIATAQASISAVIARRSIEAQRLRQSWQPKELNHWCVLGGREFRLWDNADATLAATIAATAPPGLRIAEVVADDPASASPLAILAACRECDTLLTADLARADFPELLAKDLPWVSWLTKPRIPSFAAAGPRDGLLLVDPAWRERAISEGWPGHRVAVAAWPDIGTLEDDRSDGKRPGLVSIIADTVDTDPGKRLDEFSSHRLLWDALRSEVLERPLAVGESALRFLDERLEAYGVPAEGLDHGLFCEKLIRPAYAQGIARLLASARLPLRLFGKGWADLPEFAPYAAGSVDSLEQLRRAAAQSAVLVHAWPSDIDRPLHACGRRVVNPGSDPAVFLRNVRRAWADPAAHHLRPFEIPALSAAGVIGLLNAARA